MKRLPVLAARSARSSNGEITEPPFGQTVVGVTGWLCPEPAFDDEPVGDALACDARPGCCGIWICSSTASALEPSRADLPLPDTAEADDSFLT